MHEVSLASALVNLVLEEVEKAGATRATKVIVEIGALSHVDARALQFAYDSAILGTAAEGAVFELEEPPGRAWCLDCSQVVTISRRGDACPHCGGAKLMVQGGEDMKLKAMEVV